MHLCVTVLQVPKCVSESLRTMVIQADEDAEEVCGARDHAWLKAHRPYKVAPRLIDAVCAGMPNSCFHVC